MFVETHCSYKKRNFISAGTAPLLKERGWGEVKVVIGEKFKM
jgi:hypothetical protein